MAANILLVEDDADTARALSRALENSGYRVTAVDTGSEAKALIVHLHPDLILLDLMLPDTDGLVLTTALKGLTNAPIIICSARTEGALHGRVTCRPYHQTRFALARWSSPRRVGR